MAWVDYAFGQDSPTHTFASLSVPNPGANRWLILGVWTVVNEGKTITSCTIGGVTATELGIFDPSPGTNDGPLISFWKAPVPTGTSVDAVMTFNNGNWGGVACIAEVDGEPTLNDFQATVTETHPTVSLSLAVPANGHVLAIFGNEYSDPDPAQSWDSPLVTDLSDYTTVGKVIAGSASGLSAQTLTVTLNANLGFYFNAGLGAISFSTGGGGGTSYSRALEVASTSTAAIASSRTLNRVISVASTSAAALSRIRKLYRVLEIAATSAVSLSRLRRLSRAFSATSSSVANFSRFITFNRALSVVSESVVSLSASVAGATLRALSIASSSAIEITRTLRFNRSLSISSSSGSTFNRTKRLYRTISVASASAAALTATIVAVGISRALVIASNSAVAISRTLNSVRTFFAAFSSTVTLSPEYSPIEGIRNVAFTAEQSETHLSFYPVETTVQVTIIDTNGVIDS